MLSKLLEILPKEEQKTVGNSSKKREKDPKKVAAGKKLAEYNKKAKEALAREMKREEETKNMEEQNENKNTDEEANQKHGFQSYLLLLFYPL